MTTEKEKNRKTLLLWQERFDKAKQAQAAERERFAEREKLYRGIRDETELDGSEKAETPHIYNIVSELIESQVDSSVYPVKVTAGHAGNEAKALKIEHRINDIITRLATEEIVDLAERTVPIQGGVYYHIEWDNSRQTHTSRGGISISTRHPMNVIVQDGVTSVDEMDYIFLEIGQTEDFVLRTYGIDVSDEGEDSPEARSVYGETSTADGFVTLRIAYYRNTEGGIGKVAWVNDILLYDISDFEARRLKRCANCAEPMPPECEADTSGAESSTENERSSGKVICPKCGGTVWKENVETFETLVHDIYLDDERIIPCRNADGTPVKIPYYRPRMLPIILQKSISVPNQLLGASDVDMIEDQQRTMNRLSDDILKRLMSFGGLLVLPPDATIDADGGYNIVRPSSIADADSISLKDMQLNISQFTALQSKVYEEAKNLIGITDSYLGRYDSSAKSGIAKQISSAQAAGRLQSKRTMKAAAWARIYEIMFKYLLAYDDDTHDVMYRGSNGEVKWECWNRFDYLECDENGEWYWDDDYLFSTDASISLASSREQLWQQVLGDFTSGAYGDPHSIDALLHLWRMREVLHYPLAGQTKQYLEAKAKAEAEAAQMQMQAALLSPEAIKQIQQSDGSLG